MRANRIDANQPKLVEIWRKLGVFVQLLNAVKDGCPDVLLLTEGLTLTGQFDIAEAKRRLEGMPGLIIHDGACVLVEIKDGHKKKLTESERVWWEKAAPVGAKVIVHNESESMSIIREPIEAMV